MSDKLAARIYDILRNESEDAGEYVSNRHLAQLAEALAKKGFADPQPAAKGGGEGYWQKAYNDHLRGSEIERARLHEIGVVDVSGEDQAGDWCNDLAERAEKERDTLAAQVAALSKERDEALSRMERMKVERHTALEQASEAIDAECAAKKERDEAREGQTINWDSREAWRKTAEEEAAAFKNFHRSLCARFGYCHDEVDWRRDQVSLEEHIAVLAGGDLTAAAEAKVQRAITAIRELIGPDDAALRTRLSASGEGKVKLPEAGHAYEYDARLLVMPADLVLAALRDAGIEVSE